MCHETEKEAEGQLTRTTTSGPHLDITTLMEMVERACAKDRLAFSTVYEHYREPLGRRLAYLIGDKDVAYELYQETFIRFWTHLPMQPPRHFEAWLYSIARNIAFDYLRHVKKLEFLSLPANEPGETGDYKLFPLLSETGLEERVCEMLCIQQALAEMSPQYRVCVLLQDLWGYSQYEIAGFLGISESAVSANVSRGHKQLRIAYWNMMDGQHSTRKGGQTR